MLQIGPTLGQKLHGLVGMRVQVSAWCAARSDAVESQIGRRLAEGIVPMLRHQGSAGQVVWAGSVSQRSSVPARTAVGAVVGLFVHPSGASAFEVDA